MSIDTLNSLAAAVAIIGLMIVIGLTRKQIGAAWLVVCLELLLSSILLRCIDEIAASFGVDLIDRLGSIIIRWLVIVIISFEFAQVWKRRAEIKRLEHERHMKRSELREREAQLEMMWQEYKQKWGIIE